MSCWEMNWSKQMGLQAVVYMLGGDFGILWNPSINCHALTVGRL